MSTEVGLEVKFKSVAREMYLSAENGGGARIVAKKTSCSVNETFTLHRIAYDTYNLNAPGKQFVGLSHAGNNIVAHQTTPGRTEDLVIQTIPGYVHRVRIKASNGKYVQVQNEDIVTADYEGNEDPDNPSVFLLNIS